jgi:hypothetical protein
MKPLRQRRALPIFYKFLLILCLCGCIIIPSFLHTMKASADGNQAGKKAGKQVSPQDGPKVSNTISGTVTYYDPTSAIADCAGNPAKPLSNVTVQTTSGTPSGTSNTGAPPSTGNYSITGLGTGPYTVAPSRPDQAASDPSISTTDATRVLQAVAATITLTPCQQLAADATGNGTVSSTDATRILQYVANVSSAPNPNISGTWKFAPSSRNYVTLLSDQTGQNYSGIIVGDVTGNGNPQSPQGKGLVPQAVIPVSLPTTTTPPNTVTTITIPVAIGDVTGQGVTDYSFTITFDASKITPAATPFSTAGTLSSGMTVVPNANVPGQLTIVAAQVNPLAGSGTLINLIFQTASVPATTPPQFTTLHWTSFLFGESANTASLTDGRISFFTPTAVKFSDCGVTAYDNGSAIEWQTGYEAENLGFNIYREEGGRRKLVNSNVIAGSALKAKSGFGSGDAYAWWDDNPNPKASYWIEDIDLNGKSIWHGPFSAKYVGGLPPERSRAALLSNLGNRAKENSTRVVEDRSLDTSKALFKATGQNAVIEMAKNSSASEPSFKIAIKDSGWYRITQPELVAAGLKSNTGAANLQLFVDGREVPIAVSSKGGVFDAQSAIEFYATALNTLSTDTHIYWLVVSNQAGLRIPEVEGSGAETSNRNFTQTVERKDRSIYFSSLLNGDEENFFGAVVNNTPLEQTITLTHLDVANASLEVALQGVSKNSHRVTVSVNGLQAGDVVFESQQHSAVKFSLPNSFLREGSNTVSLVSQNGSRDVSLLDYLRISYPHSYIADNDYLSFTADGKESVTISGFTSKNVRIFDVTDPYAVKELAYDLSGKRKKGFKVTVTPTDSGKRNLIATTQDQSKKAMGIIANQPSNLRSTDAAADLVIITRRDLFPAIESLKVAREQEGYRVAIVDIEDIYDEFNYGNKSPQAVKDFLSYAKSNWNLAPKFVVLAGDASFDPKNYLGFGFNDWVPTKLIDTTEIETASDDWFTDFNNDGIADIAIGRLPIRNATEASAVISKVTRTHISSSSSSALLVSDLPDICNFEQENTTLRSLLSSTYLVNEIKRRELGDDQARSQLLAALNSGPRIVNYYGHGSTNLLRGNLLNAADAANLTNTDNLSLFTLMNCLNGYFQDVSGDSLSEALLKSDKGGAYAVWTSSGLTSPNEQAVMNQQLYNLLFGDSQGTLTLGEAIQRAKAAITDNDIRRTWILLGDPTTRIK